MELSQQAFTLKRQPNMGEHPVGAPDLNTYSPSAYIQARKELKSTVLAEELHLQVSVEGAYTRGKVDFNFYAGLILRDVFELAFPPFYLDLFTILTKDGIDPYELLRFALGLPRGFVKTTFCKVITTWLIHYGYNDFILVICATDALAQNFVSDLDEMLSNPAVEQIYGAWSANKDSDSAKQKIGYLRGRRIVLVPKGAQASVRGINIHHKRPNLIVCDDIQTREGAMSQAQNDALIDWFTGTLLKSISKRGLNRKVIFLGNMYPGECLLKKLKDNPAWLSLITGAILADGESLWPELQPVKALIEEYKHDEKMGKGHIWFAEVQNDPLDSRYRLLSAPIPSTYDHLRDTAPDASFITVDPAGFRKQSDDNVIALHYVYDGFPMCVGLAGGVWDPKTTVINIISTALEHGVSVIGIESTGYQQSLQYWTSHFLDKMGLAGQIHVVELKTLNRTKLSRIRDYISELLAGNAGMLSEARALFSYYASLYKIGKDDNRDDYLDAPAYQKQIMTEYGALLTSRAKLASSLSDLPRVVDVYIGI